MINCRILILCILLCYHISIHTPLKKKAKKVNNIKKIKGIAVTATKSREDAVWRDMGGFMMNGADIVDMAPFIDQHRSNEMMVLVSVSIKADEARVSVPTIGIMIKVNCDTYCIKSNDIIERVEMETTESGLNSVALDDPYALSAIVAKGILANHRASITS